MGLADQSCHDKSMPNIRLAMFGNIRLALPNMAKLIAHAVVHSLCPPVPEARTCPPCAAPACRKRSSSRRRGKTCTCLPCPAPVCDRHFKLCGQDTRVRPVPHPCRAMRRKRFALYGLDTHFPALSRTCVRGALRAGWARYARVCPVPHLCAGAASLRCRTLPGPP